MSDQTSIIEFLNKRIQVLEGANKGLRAINADLKRDVKSLKARTIKAEKIVAPIQKALKKLTAKDTKWLRKGQSVRKTKSRGLA